MVQETDACKDLDVGKLGGATSRRASLLGKLRHLVFIIKAMIMNARPVDVALSSVHVEGTSMTSIAMCDYSAFTRPT